MITEHHYMVVVSITEGDESSLSVFSDTNNQDILFQKAVDKLVDFDEEERKGVQFIRVDAGILASREKEC